MARLTVIGAALGVAVAILVVWYIMSAPDGRKLFEAENCVKCHVIRGEGIGVIDLTGVVQRHGREWVKDQIKTPELHKPNIGMPSFAFLSDREVNALVDYLESE